MAILMKNNKIEIIRVENKCWEKSVLAIFFLFTIGSVYGQQGPLYSQYMFNMLNINPAYAGNRAVNNINFVHREQWTGFAGNPKTTFLSWDKRQQESNVGYGIQVYNDQLGIENTTGIQGFYSYRLPFDDQSTLTLGLNGGVLNYNANYSGSTVFDGGDPSLNDESVWRPTCGFGAMYFKNEWYLGFSIPSLLKTIPTSSDTAKNKDPFRSSGFGFQYFFTGGYILEVTDKFVVKPSTLVKYAVGAPVQIDLNMNMWWENKYGIGFSYRSGNAYVGLVEWQITNQIRIGYAFDYTATAMNRYNQGSHEVMLRYEFDTSSSFNVNSPRYY
jgi:type IX secretion system PorP/SprF family membrane protein